MELQCRLAFGGIVELTLHTARAALHNRFLLGHRIFHVNGEKTPGILQLRAKVIETGYRLDVVDPRLPCPGNLVINTSVEQERDLCRNPSRHSISHASNALSPLSQSQLLAAVCIEAGTDACHCFRYRVRGNRIHRGTAAEGSEFGC